MLDDLILKGTILNKLNRKGKWGASHTSFDNLQKGIPKHLRGKCKDIAENLIVEGLILEKTTSYGRHVSLNSNKKSEIEFIINAYLEAIGKT